MCKIKHCKSRRSVWSGTGSGIGTYILSVLEDEYPEIFRLVVSCVIVVSCAK